MSLRSLTAVLLAPVALAATVACSADPEPIGPRVKGFALPDARAALMSANVRHSVVGKDGVRLDKAVNQAEYTVCDVVYANEIAVRLVVAKKC